MKKNLILFMLLFSCLILSSQTIDVTVNESKNGVPGSVVAVASDPSLTINYKWTDEQGNVLLEETGSISAISNLPLGSTVCLHATTFDIACDLSVPAEMYDCFTITGNSCDGFPVEIQVRNEDTNSPICSCCFDGFMTISFLVVDESCWYSDPNNDVDYTLRWLDNNSGSAARNELSVGRYCVEMIISQDETCEPGCKSIKCFEIESSRESPLEINTIHIDICKSSILHTDDDPFTADFIETVTTNGWISIMPSNGDGDYSITWLDNPNAGFDRIISEPGEYCAIISDQCGDEIVECWDIDFVETDAYCLQYPGFLNLESLNSSDFNGLFSGLIATWTQFPNSIDLNEDIHAIFDSYENEEVLFQIEKKQTNEWLGLYKLDKFSSAPSVINRSDAEAQEKYPRLDEKLDVEVFPNPANSIINLNINSGTQCATTIEIFNLHGKRVFHNATRLERGRNTVKILVDNLPSGMYFLNVGDKYYSKISIFK